VFGHHENHVMNHPADRKGGDVKGLGIDLSIHRLGEKFPEGGLVNVGGRQDGFVGIETGP